MASFSWFTITVNLIIAIKVDFREDKKTFFQNYKIQTKLANSRISKTEL